MVLAICYELVLLGICSKRKFMFYFWVLFGSQLLMKFGLLVTLFFGVTNGFMSPMAPVSPMSNTALFDGKANVCFKPLQMVCLFRGSAFVFDIFWACLLIMGGIERISCKVIMKYTCRRDCVLF